MPSVGAVTSNLNVVVPGVYPYTAKANDLVLASAVSGAVTITMPTTPPVNSVVAVKKTDSTTSAVSIVAPGGTAIINGDTSAVLAVTGAAATFQYDGSTWQLISTGTINTAPIAGLPTGGSADQVLKKNSATNYDVSWGTASAGGGGGGEFYPWAGAGRVFFGPPMTGNSYNGTPQGYNTNMTLWPVRIPNACTVASISVASTAAGGSATAYMALYSDEPTATSFGPGTRLAGGSVVFPATAHNAATVTLNYVFTQATNVWVHLGSTAATALHCHGSGFNGFPTSLAPAPISQVFAYYQSAGSPLVGRSTNQLAATSTAANLGPTTFTPYSGFSPVFAFTLG